MLPDAYKDPCHPLIPVCKPRGHSQQEHPFPGVQEQDYLIELAVVTYMEEVFYTKWTAMVIDVIEKVVKVYEYPGH